MASQVTQVCLGRSPDLLWCGAATLPVRSNLVLATCGDLRLGTENDLRISNQRAQPGFSARPLLEELWIWVTSVKKGFAHICERQRAIFKGRILGSGYFF